MPTSVESLLNDPALHALAAAYEAAAQAHQEALAQCDSAEADLHHADATTARIQKATTELAAVQHEEQRAAVLGIMADDPEAVSARSSSRELARQSYDLHLLAVDASQDNRRAKQRAVLATTLECQIAAAELARHNAALRQATESRLALPLAALSGSVTITGGDTQKLLASIPAMREAASTTLDRLDQFDIETGRLAEARRGKW